MRDAGYGIRDARMKDQGLRIRVARLIVRAPNWLGDAIMALPALEAVRRAHADRTLIVAARPAVAPLFAEETPIRPDEVVTVEDARETAQLRDLKADAILLLPNSFSSAWRASRSGIAERWGYRAGGRGWLLTQGISRPRGRVHHVEYYRTLVRGLGIEPDDKDAVPRLAARPQTLTQADALLRERGVAPGTPLVGFAP